MSIRVGQYIRHCLEGSEELLQITDGRIFPIVAPEDGRTGYPLVTYALDAMDEQSSKDGVFGDTASTEVLVVARTQEDLEEAAELVRHAMSRGWSTWNDNESRLYYVNEQTLRVGPEDYDIMLDGFVLPMYYTIEMEDN